MTRLLPFKYLNASKYQQPSRSKKFREQWDLIVMTYTLADMENAAFLLRVKDSLKPGGVVVVEQMNAGGTGKGPANALFRSFQE